MERRVEVFKRASRRFQKNVTYEQRLKEVKDQVSWIPVEGSPRPREQWCIVHLTCMGTTLRLEQMELGVSSRGWGQSGAGAWPHWAQYLVSTLLKVKNKMFLTWGLGRQKSVGGTGFRQRLGVRWIHSVFIVSFRCLLIIHVEMSSTGQRPWLGI